MAATEPPSAPPPEANDLGDRRRRMTRPAGARSAGGRVLAIGATVVVALAAIGLVLTLGEEEGAIETSDVPAFQEPDSFGLGGMTAFREGPPAPPVARPGEAVAAVPEVPPGEEDDAETTALLDTLGRLETRLGEMEAARRQEVAALRQSNQELALAVEEERQAREREVEQALRRQEARLRAELAVEQRDQAADDSSAAEDEELLRQRYESEMIVFDGAGVAPISATGEGGARPSRPSDDNEAFLTAAATSGHETVRSSEIEDPSRTLVQGSVINGALETAISSELPGVIRAVVSADTYSYDASQVLLPRGSRLIGEYRADIELGQSRILVAWTRAVTPDGTSVELGGIGADRLGRSGLTGFVDTRFAQRFGSAALISVIGAVPVVVAGEADGEVSSDVGRDVGEDLRDSTESAVDRYLTLPPTIFVDQGEAITVLVNRDLVFP